VLKTSNQYSNAFLEPKHLLLDSCILIDLASDARTQEVLERAAKTYSFVYCAVSMLEVGFGPIDKRDENQHQLAQKIYGNTDVIRLNGSVIVTHEHRGVPYPAGTIYSWTPEHHEWFAARNALLTAMEILNISGKRARELSNDAIIFFSAWNSRSSIITNNVSDFQVFNKTMSDKVPQHKLPVFTIDDLERSFDQDVSFPENCA